MITKESPEGTSIDVIQMGSVRELEFLWERNKGLEERTGKAEEPRQYLLHCMFLLM